MHIFPNNKGTVIQQLEILEQFQFALLYLVFWIQNLDEALVDKNS